MPHARVQVQIHSQCVLFLQTVIEHNNGQHTHIGMKLRSIIHYFIGKGRKTGVNTTPQRNVSIEKYLGRWYEQARFENWFEEGLEEVFTDYTAGPDGSINVVNCGKKRNGHQCSSRGRAYPCGAGRLKVSFVPPYGWFKAPYHILYTDPDYQGALVSGDGEEYLWLLTREKTPDSGLLETLRREAQKRGFDTALLRQTRQ
ncbi:MAG: lipocalin family protein [Akkermansia sp.]|nr:lipocalin family protein [Akkermansia sp.]